jgi:hypothetical protein
LTVTGPGVRIPLSPPDSISHCFNTFETVVLQRFLCFISLPVARITTPLTYDRKGRITINNVPPGDHNFIIHTTRNYPVKRINDTIHFSTNGIQANQLVKTKKYKINVAYHIATGISSLGITLLVLVGAIQLLLGPGTH